MAFGSGAGGNFGGFSYQVQGDLESYLATPKGEKNIAFMSGHSPNKALLSKVQHDIETGRLNPSLFDGNKAAQKLIAQWQEMQLFKEPDSDGLIRLNTSGRYWSPTLIRKLMLTLPTQEKDQTMQKLSAEQQTMLRQSLEKNPSQVLEMLAAQNQCSFEDVIRCLPEENVRQTEGSRIVEILQAIAAYTVISITNTAPPSPFWNDRSWVKPLARSTLSTATAAPCLKSSSAATKQAS